MFWWIAMLVGSVLRVLWPLDMEYKGDEVWMFQHAQQIVAGGSSWPWVGMPSGAGLPNPGFSVWPFIGLAHFCSTPAAMAIAVQWLNVLALWGFAAWGFWRAPQRIRSAVLWGVALFAVSPLPILFARKIWAQDLLLPLLVLFWWAHSYRHRVGGALLWGGVGALLGQLHMSGFFFAFAVVLLTYRRHLPVRWWAWLMGSVVGAVPLLPWLSIVAHGAGNGGWDLGRVLNLKYFLLALTNALGIGLDYSLGWESGLRFFASPFWGDRPLWLVGIAHAVLLGVGLWMLLQRLRGRNSPSRDPDLAFFFAIIFGTGVLLQLTAVKMQAHYLIVVSPWLHVALAGILQDRSRWLKIVVILQAFISIAFLVFVHVEGGVVDGDYGSTYRQQMISLPSEFAK